MAEIPEHLLQRSKDRRKALGLPVEGEDAAPAPEAAAGGGGADAGTPPTPPTGGGGDEPPADGGDATPEEPAGGGDSRIPAHLLERSKKRRAAKAGGDDAAAAASAGGGGGTATAVKTAPPPSGTGPGGHTQRLLTVVKSGSIQQTKVDAVDKVHTWPHLLSVEFAALLGITALVTIFSALVRAPLLSGADFNATPNPSKAPWYFLGLQELLTMFHPMIAGVTLPGVALIILGAAPYVDTNTSLKPNNRKFLIAMFTLFLAFWAVLTIIGSFFRGAGFNFVFPWNDGIFFEL